MNPNNQKLLLQLARAVLRNKILDLAIKTEAFNLPQFRLKRGVFVSLHKATELRGCVGRIDPGQSIFKNVSSLALAAALDDPRFEALTQRELDLVKIEISILSPTRKLEGSDNLEIMNQIRPNMDGVVLKAGGNSATFLPQVWQSLPTVEQFVTELCYKAGLERNYWQTQAIELEVYQVDHFSE